MVGLMAAIAVMMILSTVAVQEWKEVLRRDNEAEMMFRAQEIARSIRRYQKDHGALPTELKQLMEPGSRQQYFLRRLYKDPLVKGGAWGLLYASPQGGVIDPSAPAGPEGAAGGGAAPTTAGGLKINPIGTTPQPGARSSAFGQIGDASGATGLPIAGVKSLCKDKPFRVYQDQTDYAHWLFSIYDLEGGAAGGAGGEGGQAPPPTGGTPPPTGGGRMPAPPPPPPPPGG
jgi:type II secretory pathway pseudopilin PulG